MISSGSCAAPLVEVLIEVSRGSFLKRTRGGAITLVSPYRCPFNYGSVPAYRGLDRDDLDVLVLGPRMRRLERAVLPAYAAVGMSDGGEYDDKLICAASPPTEAPLRAVVRFFVLFACAKRVLYRLRGRPGPTRFELPLPTIDSSGRCRRPNAWPTRHKLALWAQSNAAG